MDQIEEVRRKLDIVELVSQYLPLKKAGRNFKALCPFHEEKTPSFMVSQERQIWKCFGCGEGGDVYGFVMRKEGMEFGEALRYLADKAGIELKDYRPTGDQKLKEKLLAINHLASEFYHYLLTEHQSGKKALQYLLKRGIRKDSIRLFKLGYAPNTWDSLIRFLVNKKKYRSEDVGAAGLLIQSDRGGAYDRFRGRIIFPLYDHRGRVVGFSGRVLADKQEAKYINSPETRLYHKSSVLYGLETTKEEIKKKNRAVVVEGEIDLISSYQAGVKNVVAIKGSALTEEQIDLLKRFTDNLTLALDSDAAGDSASRRGIELAEKAGLDVRVIQLKFGKDPDECSQKSSRLWKDSVKEAVPVYDFYLDSAIKRFGVKTVAGKRRVSDELAGILAGVSNQVIRAHYIKKVAEKLGVGEEAVEVEVEKKEKGMNPGAIEEEAQPDKPRQERLEEYLLALVVQSKEWIEELVRKVELEVFGEAAVKKILTRLKAWLSQGKTWEVNKFAKSLAPELVAQLDAAFLTDLRIAVEDNEKLERELGRTMAGLKRIKLKQKLDQLSQAIKQLEAKGDKTQVKQLEKEFSDLAKKLKDN